MESIQQATDQLAETAENVDPNDLDKQDWKNIALVGLPIVAILSPWIWNKVKGWVWSPSAYDGPGEGRGTSLGMSGTEVPGRERALTTRALEKTSESFQKFGPVERIHQHLCGFHLYASDPSRVVIAHHYCSHLNDEIQQCVIYDSTGENARLVGIEYVISEDLFETLPVEERKLWHSHTYEVKSGQLAIVNVPDMMEYQTLKKLIKTYGKTVHTWQFDRGDELPLGLPEIMISSTREGEVPAELVKKRDIELNINTEEKVRQRRSLKGPTPSSQADWVSRNGPMHLQLVSSGEGVRRMGNKYAEQRSYAAEQRGRLPSSTS